MKLSGSRNHQAGVLGGGLVSQDSLALFGLKVSVNNSGQFAVVFEPIRPITFQEFDDEHLDVEGGLIDAILQPSAD